MMTNAARIAAMKREAEPSRLAGQTENRAAQQADAVPARDRDCPDPTPSDLVQGRRADTERHPGGESYCPWAVDPDHRSGRETAQQDPFPTLIDPKQDKRLTHASTRGPWPQGPRLANSKETRPSGPDLESQPV